MIIDSIALTDFEVFSKIDRDLNNIDTSLNDFFRWKPELSSFKSILEQRKFNTNRQVLVDVLNEQYAVLPSKDKSTSQINSLLQKNTFTVCTAHQPSLFGGPVFVISKALSAIKLARQVQESQPDYNIIPVFVIGSEDHDVEELNNTYVHGVKITWNTDQKGPVGRFDNVLLENNIAEFKSLISGSKFENELNLLIESAYSSAKSFGQSFQYLLAELLGEYGLLVLNTDHPSLKKLLSPYIQAEINESKSKLLVNDTQSKLQNLGYDAASFARDINFFYFDKGYRERIEPDGENCKIAGIEKTISKSELISEAASHPERFSPNVIMRPVYQEIILPNLAYVGGGGELAYWLERKNLFEHLKVPFPMLVRRDSFLIAQDQDINQMKEYQLHIDDLDDRNDIMINNLTERISTSDLNLKPEEQELLKWMDQIKQKSMQIDPTLGAMVESEKVKLQKSVEYIEKKILKAEKQKQEVLLNRAKKLKDRLMPEGKLAERKENFSTYYSMYGRQFFETLLEDFNPLDFKFKIIKIGDELKN